MPRYTTRTLPSLRSLDDALSELGGKEHATLAHNTVLHRSVQVTPRGNREAAELTLHGKPIVRWTREGAYVSLAGWPTVTTRQRINAVIPSRPVWQSKHEQWVEHLTPEGEVQTRIIGRHEWVQVQALSTATLAVLEGGLP